MAKITLFEVIAILIVILVTVGCSKTLYSNNIDEPINQVENNQLVENQIVEECNCTENRVCQDGECVCSKKHKLCNDKCIPKDACCSNDDCDNGKCIDNKCVFCGSCKTNEICQDGDCICKPGTKFCKEQDMCINEDFCCSNIDCINNRDRKLCSLLKLSSEICIEKDHKLCKFLNTERYQSFIIEEKHFKVDIEHIFDNSIELRVHLGNHTGNYTMDMNEKIEIEGYKIWLNSIKTIGGVCVER